MAVKKTTKIEPKAKLAPKTKPTPKVKSAPKAEVKPAPKTKPAPKKVIPIKPKKEPEVIELPGINNFPSLKKGSKETGYITLLQTNLKNRGYYEGPVDGKYGDKTEEAVMEFQKDLKKPVSGTVGPKTWDALKTSDLVRVKPQVKPQPQPPAPPPGYKVVIDGLTRYQADLLIKLLQGHTECRIV